jgi:hypothetical protein
MKIGSKGMMSVRRLNIDQATERRQRVSCIIVCSDARSVQCTKATCRSDLPDS